MSGDLETELATLCHRYFDPPYADTSSSHLLEFFQRLMEENKQVSITDEIRYYIPQLAKCENGLFSTMLDPCIAGLSPMHYVPDLSLKQNLFQHEVQQPKEEMPKNSVRIQSTRARQNLKKSESSEFHIRTVRDIQTARNFRRRKTTQSISELNQGYQLTLPKRQPPSSSKPRQPMSARSIRRTSIGMSRKSDRFAFRQQLPPLERTQDNVISNLYIRDKPAFYTGKIMDPKGSDISIIPPQYPQYKIGNQFEVLSTTGVIKVDGNVSEVTPLADFVQQKSNEFIVQQIFKNNIVHKCFFIWRERFREKRFNRIVNKFDKQHEIAHPLFSQLIDQIRNEIISTTDPLNVFPTEFETGVNDVKFEEFQKVSAESINQIDDAVLAIEDNTSKCLSDFFRQIRSTNLQMQLDFEELHSLNLLPASLEDYSSDLKWRFPSLSREKERNILLEKERNIALKRQYYLGKFFIRAVGVYNGMLVKQCQSCINRFLRRFSKSYPEMVIDPPSSKTQNSANKIHPKKRRANKIYSLFSLDDGLVFQPTYKEFKKWILGTVSGLKHAFLLQNKMIPIEIINEIEPEFEYQFEDPLVIIDRFREWQTIQADSLEELSETFKFFETKMQKSKYFMKQLKEQVEFSRKFNDFRNTTQLQFIIDGLLESDQTIIHMPRNIFHKLNLGTDEIIDYILEMRLLIEESYKYLTSAIKDFKQRAVNELTNNIFNEIQEKWAAVNKEKSISKADTKYIESRLTLYSLISKSLADGWPDIIPDLKGTFDTLISVYRSLNNQSRYTHIKSLENFNICADKMGITGVSYDPANFEEEEEEEDEDESKGKTDSEIEKKKKKKKRKSSKNKNKIAFDDKPTQTINEEEEEIDE